MKRNLQLTLTAIIIVLTATFLANGQVASNPPYTLDQAAIASGGGNNSTGGAFALDGTIGQSAAGTRSTNSPFALAGGFWTANALAPTAAAVSISGRVLTFGGRGLRNALVILTAPNGESQTVLTGAFGYFRFAEVASGQTYIIEVRSKRYTFAPQIVAVTEEMSDLNFVAQTENLWQP